MFPLSYHTHPKIWFCVSYSAAIGQHLIPLEQNFVAEALKEYRIVKALMTSVYLTLKFMSKLLIWKAFIQYRVRTYYVLDSVTSNVEGMG